MLIKLYLLNQFQFLKYENPQNGTIMQVNKNIGGQLVLEDLLDSSLENKHLKYVFFTNHLLRPLGWLKEHYGLSR